jgi:single-stranded-DNA-specific exonuclease
VDCGSVSYDEVEYIKSLGMNVIVTDHHTIDDVQADCILINPKQKDCTYPFKDLAGCGVAFKLAQGLQQKAGLPKSLLNSVLDLVAVGTVGDIVSLKDENRTIVKYGLNRINANARPALNKLKEAISFKSISAENIAFGIAPHINAAGRMAHASEAAKLFLTSSEAEMDEQVKKLVEYNTRRKKEQDTAFKSCLEYIKGDEDIIILRLDYIHEGIAGIVAGKIKEEFNRTAIIVTPSDGVYLKGTGRSIENINIYDLLNGHNELFTRFGGHKAACGFLMPVENYDVFKSSLEADVEAMKEANPDLYGKTTEWDEVLEPGEVTCELAKEMEKLEPCGQGNPKPKFRLENVKGMYPFFMGSDETHVKFKAVSRDGDQAECILFQRAQVYKDRLFGGGEVSLIGSVNYQTWRGVDRVQFVVEEIL